jgi:predicted SprT family Zn-dependent metalloprotease
LGHTIEVTENKRLAHERNWTGAACYDETRIELLPISEQHPFSVSKHEQTFCHELSHFLLYYSGAAINHELNGKFAHQNEELVDLLGSLLHQVLTTMEFD